MIVKPYRRGAALARLSIGSRWSSAQRRALETLLTRHYGWLRHHARRRLGQRLRGKTLPSDIAQNVAVHLIEYGPKFLDSNVAQFRALLGRMVENVVRDEVDWFSTLRRSIDREQPLSCAEPGQDPRRGFIETPPQLAARREAIDWLRSCLQRLTQEDQAIIELRYWADSFDELATWIGSTKDAVRMRYNRAVARLASQKSNRANRGASREAFSYL